MEHKKYQMKGTALRDITLENICGTDEIPPVSYWAPRREEIQRFVEIAKAVHNGEGRPKVLDVGCGTGFLACLLARTGEVDVIGLDPEQSLIHGSPYSHPNLRLEVGDSNDAVKKYGAQDFDIVLNSWMPAGLNLTPDIRDIRAKAIIYIKEREATGVPSYNYNEFIYEDGFDEWNDDADQHKRPNPISPENGISYHPGRDYQRAFEWFGPACSEVQALGRKLKGLNAYIGLFEDLNFIDIQFRRDVQIPEIPEINIPSSDKYSWEASLEILKGPVCKMKKYEEFSW